MPSLIVESLCRIAATLTNAGRRETAAQLLAASQAFREELGGGFAWVAKTNEETLSKLRAELDEETLSSALERGRRLTSDEAVSLALNV